VFAISAARGSECWEPRLPSYTLSILPELMLLLQHNSDMIVRLLPSASTLCAYALH
jgi:hypothetical protein